MDQTGPNRFKEKAQQLTLVWGVQSEAWFLGWEDDGKTFVLWFLLQVVLAPREVNDLLDFLVIRKGGLRGT